jgi:valyl-tRNA synthetase
MSLNFDIIIHSAKDEKPVFEAIESYIKRMAKVENISYADVTAPIADKSATAVVSASKIAIPLENLIDFDAEIARQEKKLGKLQNERKSLEGRINNPKFVANAPTELIQQTKDRIEEILVQENAINELVKSLKS